MTDLPSLAYSRPQTLADALAALRRRGACPYAGGTDLLVALQHRDVRLAWVRELVDIKDLADASGIREERGGLRLGALVTARELVTNSHLRHVPALLEAAAATSAPLLRARGTIGGNLVTPHPAGDVATALLVLGASVDVVGTRGTVRRVSVARLMAATPAPRQLLLAVHVPGCPASAFEKIAHRHAFARSTVAVAVARHGGSLRIALGGVHARPIVATLTTPEPSERRLTSLLSLRELEDARIRLVISLVRRSLARIG